MPTDDLSQSFSTRVDTVGGLTILALGGELDLATRPRAQEAFDAALAAGPQTLVINLNELEFMDSTGLHFLLTARSASADAGVRLVLLGGSGPAHRTMELGGVLDTFELLDDVADLRGGSPA